MLLFKLNLAIIVIGGLIAFWGFEEFRISMGSTTEPMAVELSALEKTQNLTIIILKSENT